MKAVVNYGSGHTWHMIQTDTTADDNLGTMAMVFAAVEAVDGQERVELSRICACQA